jgi:parallel beta-helix repeat protein
MQITNDSITLDCQGYNLTGDGNSDTDYGVYIASRSHIRVLNCRVYNFGEGVFMQTNLNLTIANNTVENIRVRGFYLKTCSDIVFANNTATDTGLYGLDVDTLSNSTFINNVFSDSSNGLYLLKISGSNVTNNTMFDTTNGITLSTSSYTLLRNNTMYNNRIVLSNVITPLIQAIRWTESPCIT